MADWVPNEDTLMCSCGYPAMVKTTPEGKVGALCFAHTKEAGAWIALPAQKPDDVIPYPNGEPDWEVGQPIPPHIAKYFAEVMRTYLSPLDMPEYQKAPLVALYHFMEATAEGQT